MPPRNNSSSKCWRSTSSLRAISPGERRRRSNKMGKHKDEVRVNRLHETIHRKILDRSAPPCANIVGTVHAAIRFALTNPKEARKMVQSIERQGACNFNRDHPL